MSPPTPLRLAALPALEFVTELKGLDWLTVAAGWLGAGAAAGAWGLGILTCGRHILSVIFWAEDALVLLIELAAQEAHDGSLTSTDG